MLTRDALKCLVFCGVLLQACCVVPSRHRFVTFAEAVTPTDGAGKLRVRARLFSAPDLTERCARLGPPERIAVSPRRVTVRLNASYDLESLRIEVKDRGGQVIAGAPLAFDANDPGAGSDALQMEDGRLIIRAPGSRRLRVRALCSDPLVAATIDLMVEGQ
jgi:hypothetical protein